MGKSKYMDPESVSERDTKEILDFLNKARTAEEIATAVELPGRWDTSIRTAEAVFQKREKLGKFSDLSQVSSIEQVGQKRFLNVVNSLRTPHPSDTETVITTVSTCLEMAGTPEFSKRQIMDIIAMSEVPTEIKRSCLYPLVGPLTTLNCRGPEIACCELKEMALELKGERLKIVQAGFPIGSVIAKIITLLAALFAVGMGIEWLAKKIEGDPETEKIYKFHADRTIDKNTVIDNVVGDSTIRNCTAELLYIKKVDKGVTLYITWNDAKILIEENLGKVVIICNDENVVIKDNQGIVVIQKNLDTIQFGTNSGRVEIDTNNDTIEFSTNTGEIIVNGNEDIIIVKDNEKEVTIKDNNDTIYVNKNGGVVNVDGNRGGTFDDAEIIVYDTRGGTINVNNNDGNVRHGEGGTVNRGGKPGDIYEIKK